MSLMHACIHACVPPEKRGFRVPPLHARPQKGQTRKGQKIKVTCISQATHIRISEPANEGHGERGARKGRKGITKPTQLSPSRSVRPSVLLSLLFSPSPHLLPPREHPSCPRASPPPPSASLRPEVLIDPLADHSVSRKQKMARFSPSDIGIDLDLSQHLQNHRIPPPTRQHSISPEIHPNRISPVYNCRWTCIVTSRAWQEADRACIGPTWIPKG